MWTVDPSPRSQSRFYSKDSQGESKYADFLLQFIALAGSPRLFLRLAVLRRTHYVARVRSYHGGRGGEAAGLTPTGMRVRPGRLPMRRRPTARLVTYLHLAGVSVIITSAFRRPCCVCFVLQFGSDQMWGNLWSWGFEHVARSLPRRFNHPTT